MMSFDTPEGNWSADALTRESIVHNAVVPSS